MGEGWKLVLSYLSCQRDECIIPDFKKRKHLPKSVVVLIQTTISCEK